jgi:hypothetical protein
MVRPQGRTRQRRSARPDDPVALVIDRCPLVLLLVHCVQGHVAGFIRALFAGSTAGGFPFIRAFAVIRVLVFLGGTNGVLGHECTAAVVRCSRCRTASEILFGSVTLNRHSPRSMRRAICRTVLIFSVLSDELDDRGRCLLRHLVLGNWPLTANLAANRINPSGAPARISSRTTSSCPRCAAAINAVPS